MRFVRAMLSLSATWLQNYSSQCGIMKKEREREREGERERERGKSEEEPRLLTRYELTLRYKPPDSQPVNMYVLLRNITHNE